MITYTVKETKKAILKWSPKHVDFSIDEFEQIKWEMILSNCFTQKGWLEKKTFLMAMKHLCAEKVFAKYTDLENNKIHFIRIN